MSRSSERTGTGCLILFALVFTCAGLAAGYFVGKSFLENLDTYRWDEAPCELLRCEIDADEAAGNVPFTLEVRYRYQIDGEQREGTRYALSPETDDDYTDLARLRNRLLSSGDGGIVAWVDPDDLNLSVIRRGSILGHAATLLIPLPFLGIGVGLLYFLIGDKSKAKGKKKARSKNKSGPRSENFARWVGIAIFSILLLVGLGLAQPLMVKPIQNAASAKSWIETPCKII